MIIKQIDETGRIGIPGPLLKGIGINGRTDMKIDIEGNKIILTKLEDVCKYCGKEQNIIKGFSICRDCAEKISNLLKLV